MMSTYVRYMLITACFTVSVTCLALWACGYEYIAGIDPGGWSAEFAGAKGLGCISIDVHDPSLMQERMILTVSVLNNSREPWFGTEGMFGVVDGGVYFPLWYASLVFALASVGVLRFRRQFSLRSTLIAFAVVAALLAMPVVL